MQTPIHTIESLFDQLGLDSSDEGIAKFVDNNSGVPDQLPLDCATFWSVSQASFIRQAKDEDADWAEIVDQLDAMLRD